MRHVKPHIKDVPLEYRKRAYTYSYNAGVTRCLNCDEDLSPLTSLTGFAEYDNGLMQIHECPNCFKKQRFHTRTKGFLGTLLELLDYKKQMENEK